MNQLSRLRILSSSLVARRTATSTVNCNAKGFIVGGFRNLSTEAEVAGNITYSGGHPKKGQGGFYGSGGSRASIPTEVISPTEHQRSKMLALQSDVEHIKTVMEEVELLSELLEKDREEHGDQVTNRSIEIRGSIKHLVTNNHFSDCLNRLEKDGKPIWGLSSEEHDLIMLAREKINQS